MVSTGGSVSLPITSPAIMQIPSRSAKKHTCQGWLSLRCCSFPPHSLVVLAMSNVRDSLLLKPHGAGQVWSGITVSLLDHLFILF